MLEANLKELDDLLGSGEYHDDPYPIWQKLREADPVHWCEPWNGWLVTRHADVEGMLSDHENLSNVGRLPKSFESLTTAHRDVVAPLLEHFDGGLQHSDPPDHTRIRSPISQAFGPAVARDLRDRVQAIVDQLLDRAIGRGEMDIVADLAEPLPALVLGEALDVAPEECERFREWDHDIAAFLGTRTEKAHLTENARRSAEEQVGWLHEITERRRSKPGTDVFTTLTQCADAGVIRDTSELHGTYLALLIGGHETTTGLISNGLLSLLRNPEQLKLLRKHPSLMHSAIEELLRYESPIFAHQRIATKHMTFGRAEIKKGQMVVPMLGSANRDPAAFEEPDRLDITRRNNRHLAFGWGIHFCLGAPLARLEGEVVFATLLRRLKNIRLAYDEVSWQRQDVFRLLESLPVEFEVA